jgi:hypothetical protein
MSKYNFTAAPKIRITNAEATVVPKPNQGTIRQRGCNPLSGSFLFLFGEAKRKRKKNATGLKPGLQMKRYPRPKGRGN